MANGNFGGGTGTEENPYLIEDWVDWMAQTDDGETYYKLTADLDGNDYNDGVWDKSKRIGFLDGNNHKLYNIKVSSDFAIIVAGENTSVKNLIVTNVETSYYVIACDQAADFTSCTFECTLSGSRPFYYGYSNNFTRGTFTDCQISISALASISWLMSGRASFYDCGIYCDCSSAASLGSGSNTYGYPYFYRCDIVANNCALSQWVSFYMCRVKCKTKITSNSNYIIGGMIANSIFVLDLSESTVLSNFNVQSNGGTATDPTYTGISIIDTDLLGEYAVLKETDYLKGLTTEQMQDIDALKASGFTNVVEVV